MLDDLFDDRKKIPIWFKILNFSFLLPILVWPIIAFGSIFIFDNPPNIVLGILLFLAINAYPVYLYIFFKLNSNLYRKNALLATIFGMLFCMALICLILYYFVI